MNNNSINFTNASSSVAYALNPFNKTTFLAKIGYWLDRNYGVSVDSSGNIVSWTCAYTGKVATPYSSAPTLSSDGSIKSNGEQFLQIPISLSLQAPGLSGTGMHIFARFKSSQSGTFKAIAGHWNAAIIAGGKDDWILFANSVSSDSRGSFFISENTTNAIEGTSGTDATNGSYTTLEGLWGGAATNVTSYNNGLTNASAVCGVANATTLATNNILLFRYAPDGAPILGKMSAELASIVHFTSPLTTNEIAYVRAYMSGLN